jgi:hypothetical protein
MTHAIDAKGGRLQIGSPAGFELECMAGFVGIRKYDTLRVYLMRVLRNAILNVGDDNFLRENAFDPTIF